MDELAKKSPAMNREFLEDVVSIKVAETETILEDKLAELKELKKSQEKICGDAVKDLANQCKADADKQVGEKLQNIVAAFNASGLFPEMTSYVGSGYGLDKEKDENDKPVEEYGVPVEIVLKQDEKAAKIARGGLPITTTTAGNRSGAKIIAATTALVTVTPELRVVQSRVDEENKKLATLDKQIDKIQEYLRNMNSSERKIRAAVARNHLNASDEGQKAIQFLDSIGLPQSLGKDVAKALPDIVKS